MKVIVCVMLAMTACGPSWGPNAVQDDAGAPEASDEAVCNGTVVACRPIDEPDAPLVPTCLWIAPGPKSDWAPCEGEVGGGPGSGAVWCCGPDGGPSE